METELLSQATVHSAYLQMHTSGAARGAIGIVSVLALLFMISKIIDIYSKHSSEKNFNIKMLFDLARQYIVYALFIIAFPVIINTFEYLLSGWQDSLTSSYNSSLTQSGNAAIANFVEEYMRDDINTDEEESSILDKGIEIIKDASGITLIMTWIKMTWQSAVMTLYMFCLYALKYVFFVFCCGRYLWLLMLEVLAPLALICTLHESTKSLFITWAKHMAICYLLVPFFLMADAFSEGIIYVMFTSMDMAQYGLLGIIAMVIVKASLFGVVSKKAHSLI